MSNLPKPISLDETPYSLPTPEAVRQYNTMIDSAKATAELLGRTIPKAQQFEEPKFVPKCVCGNDSDEWLEFFFFSIHRVAINGYKKNGDVDVNEFDESSDHDPVCPSINEDQVGMFLWCRQCYAQRKLTPEEREALSW
jgi:hypothetical protein